jgi:hypothetical protein
MPNRNIYDDEARARERRIQKGKEYLETHQRLLQRSRTDESCLPTISRMAQEFKMSEKETEELRDYAFNDLGDDERDFLEGYSGGPLWF